MRSSVLVPSDNSRANRFALICCLLFLLCGLPWIWRPGAQTDECLFTAGIYGPFFDSSSRVTVFGHEYSIMVMTYVGTLKSRIWSPIFRVFGVSAGSIRIPALIIGAISIWWFYRLLVRTLGTRAAVVGVALLAVDPIYLFTIRWDWGPVALQHVLLIGGMLGIVTWWQERKVWWLALGFFAFGLAMWDKALFAWSLVGLGAATVVFFPRRLLQSIRPVPVVVALLFFLLGATPLIIYNVRNNWVTFRSNTVRATEDLAYKAQLVVDTLNGSALFGSAARNDYEGPLRTPDRVLEKAVVNVSLGTGSPKRTVQGWMLILALLCVPLVWRTEARRAVGFALLFSIVTWAQMASLKNGGTGVHHSVLLWPMPALMIAAVAGALADRTERPWRWVGGVCAVGMLSGLLVISTYHRDTLRNGGSTAWTEAFYPAFKYVRDAKPRELLIMDWGFFDNLRAFGKGKLPLNVANDPGAGEDDKKYATLQIEDSRNLFITHTAGNEMEQGRTGRIVKFAEERGFRRANLHVFADTNGRAMIEVFNFERAGN